MTLTFAGRASPEQNDFLSEIAVLSRIMVEAGYPHADIAMRFSGSAVRIASAIDEALAVGSVTVERLLRSLAIELGLAFSDPPPPPSPGIDPREALQRRRYSAISPDGSSQTVIAPTGITILALISTRDIAVGFILTTPAGLTRALFGAFHDDITERITATTAPLFSARPPAAPAQPVFRWPSPLLLAALGGLAVLAILDPASAVILPPLLLAPFFMIGAITILACLVETLRATDVPSPLPDHALPRYAVLVPLYREGNIADQIISRLSTLDYPREKLEILLLTEADDHKTREALFRNSLPAFMRVITVPEGEPRTKPRALNAGLLVARGDLIVVYDAEDQPEPDQLRRAAATFAAAPGDVACVQARLAISNARDGLLTRRFAIDYAALFDCGKAGMARLGWPVPLGGSSNHFRTAMLRDAGAWDAWNVTEDADLGIRLARLGLRVQDLPSTTWEEAPNHIAGWMNQRTRWMKGWMQTMLVHARYPAHLVADLGLFRTIIVASLGLSVVFGALLLPLFAVGLIWRLSDALPLGSGSLLFLIADAVIVECLVLGLLAEVLPALVALKRRRALWLAPWILLAPLTYILTSIAAWRALIELVRRPHHWHKTGHGEARSSGGLSSLG